MHILDFKLASVYGFKNDTLSGHIDPFVSIDLEGVCFREGHGLEWIACLVSYTDFYFCIFLDISWGDEANILVVVLFYRGVFSCLFFKTSCTRSIYFAGETAIPCI